METVQNNGKVNYMMDFNISQIREITGRYREHHVTAFSAQMAFFVFLSIFPLIMFILSLASRFNLNIDLMFENITSSLPEDIGIFIVNFIDNYIINDSLSLLSVSGLTALWSASRGVNALMRSFNMAYGYKETRNFIILKLTGIYYTLLLIASILITIAMPALGLGFFHFISSYLPISVRLIDTLYALRYLLYLMVFIFFILSVHKVLPAGKLKYRDVYCGAVFSLIGWYILSRSFSFFVSTFTNYAAVYGGLASIVIFMMWLYFMSTVLMLGAEMNSVIMQYRKPPEQVE